MKSEHALRGRFYAVISLAMFLLILPAAAVSAEKIAFDSDRNGVGNLEIYVMNPDGSNQIRLTDNPANDLSPVYSPDGSKIVFRSQRDDNDEIYVMNADGTNQIRLTDNPAIDFHASFSPDGTKIIFTSTRNGNYEVYVMNPDGTNQTRLTNNPAADFTPAFSLDGTKIVFVSNRDGIDQIYVMNPDGTNQTRLINTASNDFTPVFTPDGTKIVFASTRDGGNAEIYEMNADGTNQTRLTNNPAVNASPSVSSDGSKIAFVSNRDGGNDEIYVMNIDGTNQIRLTDNPANDFHPSFGSPNSAPVLTPFGITRARDAGASNSQIATVSDAEDAADNLSVTVNGGGSATVSGVTVSGISVSSSGIVTANVSADCGATNASFTLRVTDSGALFNQATLNVGLTAETTAPVISLPSNIVTSLPPGSSETSKIVTFTVAATDNCDANPAVIAVPASGSQFSVGTTTVSITATDASGNVARDNFTVTVLYNFAGFFQPVDNLPLVNVAAAGSGIPVKFSLSGNKGLNIFAPGFPASQAIACTSGTLVSPIDETTAARANSLTYAAGTDRYLYVWKTEKTWRGTCRQLIVRLNDGTPHIANFQFR
jgi:Tol biopolymer transport system component